jgi:hypothetical protein
LAGLATVFARMQGEACSALAEVGAFVYEPLTASLAPPRP